MYIIYILDTGNYQTQEKCLPSVPKIKKLL